MSWTCHKCETQNADDVIHCEVCEFAYQKEPDWVCIFCNCTNAFETTKCKSCGKQKDQVKQKSVEQTIQIVLPAPVLTLEWELGGRINKRKIVDPEYKKNEKAEKKEYLAGVLSMATGAVSAVVGMSTGVPALFIFGVFAFIAAGAFWSRPFEMYSQYQDGYLPLLPLDYILIETDEIQEGVELPEPISQIDLSLDRKLLFVKTLFGRNEVFDPETGTHLGTFRNKREISFLSGGYFVETEMDNVAIKTLNKLLYIGIKSPFKSSCSDAYFSKESHSLWLVSKKGGIAFYFLKAKYRPGPDTFILPHGSLETYSPIECASYHSTLPVAVFAHKNGEVKLLRYTTNGLNQTHYLIPGEIAAIDLHPDLDFFACLTNEGVCYLTDLKGNQKTLKILLNDITSIHFLKGNEFLLLGDKKGLIHIFSIQKMEIINSIQAEPIPITKMVHLPKAKRLFTVSGKGRLTSWKVS